MKLTICGECDSENVNEAELIINLTYKGKSDKLIMHGLICNDCKGETVSESDHHYILHRFHKMKEEIQEERSGNRNITALPGGKND